MPSANPKSRPAFIAIGSNINAGENLAQAAIGLGRLLTQPVASPVYQTDPVGWADQPRFLNAVVMGATLLEPEELLKKLAALELSQGRSRVMANGPRTLDLDLLLLGEEIRFSEQLILPHPRMHQRAFVLVPFCDLAPETIHPVLHSRMDGLLKEMDLSGISPSDLDLNPFLRGQGRLFA